MRVRAYRSPYVRVKEQLNSKPSASIQPGRVKKIVGSRGLTEVATEYKCGTDAGVAKKRPGLYGRNRCTHAVTFMIHNSIESHADIRVNTVPMRHNASSSVPYSGHVCNIRKYNVLFILGSWSYNAPVTTNYRYLWI